MLRSCLTAVFAALLLAGCGVETPAEAPVPERKLSRLEGSFEQAAREYQVPAPVLKSIAYVETRVEHRPERSLTGGHGVMQLVERDDWNMLGRAAELTGQAPERLKVDPDANIRGAAAVLRELGDRSFQSYPELDPNDPADWFHAVSLYAGLTSAPMAKEYAADVYRTAELGFEAEARDGLVVQQPYATGFRRHLPATGARQDALAEYPGAYTWKASPNYSSGRTSYTYVLIHTTQGSYAGAISWFQNSSSNVSSHYVIRSSDGQITQMVEHRNTAWHAQCYNGKSIGLEHEGYVQDPAKWYTEAMYRESAKLTRWIADRHGIPRDRSRIIGHKEVPYACNTGGHYDPGTGWNWTKYMGLVNGTTTTTTGTTGKLTGAIYSGGNTANRVAGATVTAGGKTVTTGTDGLYEFILAPGTYTVNVTKSGFSSNSVSRTLTAGATVWGSMEINAVQAAGTLKGKIYVHNAAAPSDMSQAITGAVVTVSGKSMTTGADGMYSFSLAPGTHTVNVNKAGFNANTVTRAVTSGATTWGSVGLQPEQAADTQSPQVAIAFPSDGVSMDFAVVTLHGTASDNGGPLSSVKLRLNGGAWSTVTVTTGAFSEQVKLSPGQNVIELEAVDAAGNVGTASSTATFNAGISGFVYQSGDESVRIPGAVVTLIDPADGQTLATATSGADGSFSLNLTKVNADVRLTVKREGFLSSAETITLPDDARMNVSLPLVAGSELNPSEVSIEFTSPKDGERVTAETVTIYGVVHGPQITAVTVNGVGADLYDGGGFTTNVKLAMGENLIEVLALGVNDEKIPATLRLIRGDLGAMPLDPRYLDQNKVAGGCSAAPNSAALLLLGVLPLLRRRRKS